MNAARAKRRWLAWCRYTAKTGSTRTNGMSHYGGAKAFADVHFARRTPPGKSGRHVGARSPYFPKWASW